MSEPSQKKEPKTYKTLDHDQLRTSKKGKDAPEIQKLDDSTINKIGK